MIVTLPEKVFLRLAAIVETGHQAIVALRRELEERGDVPDEVMAEVIAYGWCYAGGVWLGEGCLMYHGEGWDSVPCLEPRTGEPDRYSGAICDGYASRISWGGRGVNYAGYPIFYPACDVHAGGVGRELGSEESSGVWFE